MRVARWVFAIAILACSCRQDPRIQARRLVLDPEVIRSASTEAVQDFGASAAGIKLGSGWSVPRTGPGRPWGY